jgi:HPt (histidine-containing phosphotransfer) domain-containing protein
MPANGLNSEREWISQSLAQFAELGGPPFVTEMIELFQSQSAKQMSELDRAIEGNDWATVRRIAHTLKSSLANYGVRELRTVAQKMESAAADGATHGMREQYEYLAEGIVHLRELLPTLAIADVAH